MLHNDYQGTSGESLSVEAEVGHLRLAGVDVDYLQFAPASEESKQTVARELIYSKRIRRSLIKSIERLQPDVVHVQNVFPRLGASAILAISATNTPYVQTLRNYRLSCLSANHYRNQKPCNLCRRSATAISGVRFGCYRDSSLMSGGVLVHDAAQRGVRMANKGARPHAFIVLSHSMREAMRSTLPKWADVRVKYNTLLHDPGLGKGGGGMIFVGRLSHEKGVLNLIEAWRSMPRRPRLTIVGDGPLNSDVAALVGGTSGVEFYARLCNDEVLERIKAADLLVAPAMWHEPFGRTVLEALACGTPVLATDLGAAPELIGSTGWTCRPTTGSLLAMATMAISEAPLYRTRARARYESIFSPSATTAELVRIYESVLGRADV